MDQVAGRLFAGVGGGLLDEREAGLGDGQPVGGHPRDLLRPGLGPRPPPLRLADVGEDPEVLDLARGDRVAGEQQAPGQHRAEPVEEEVEVPERGAEQPGPRHAEARVAADDREVRHQRQLERAAERVGLDLGDGDLREGQVLMVEAEGLAVDAETPPLARSPAAPRRPYHEYEFFMSRRC